MVVKKRGWKPVEPPKKYEKNFGRRLVRISPELMGRFADAFDLDIRHVDPRLVISRSLDFSSVHGIRLTEVCQPIDPRLPREKTITTLKHDESIEHKFESDEEDIHDEFKNRKAVEKELREIELEIERQKKEPGFEELDPKTKTRHNLLSELHDNIGIIHAVAKDAGLIRKLK